MSRPNNESKLAYSVSEVAEQLGVKRTTVYELMNRGELRSFTIGRRRLVSYDDLVGFIAARLEDVG